MVPFQQHCGKGATLYPYIQWGDHRLSVDRYVGSNSSGLWERSLGGRDGRDVHGWLFCTF